MRLRSLTASRLLVCLVTALLLASATAGGVTAATAAGDSTLSASDNGSLEATTDDLERAVTGATTELETETAETTDDLENSTDETSDEVENDTNETTDDLENSTQDTTAGLENVTNETTDGLENTTAVTDATTGTTGKLLEGTLTVETELGAVTADLEATADGSETASDDRSTATETSDEADADTDESEPASGTPTGTDAVLVGLLGAITASGAAASGSAGGASGAAGNASSLLTSWLNRVPGLGRLRHAGSLLPWELVPIFRYSRYDDSDPLENETRRTIYETIEADSGQYLSQVSEESGVALSTVRHHVRILEEEGLVTTAKINGKRRYYHQGERLPAARDDGDTGRSIELQAALEEPAKREVLEMLATLGPVPNGRLADKLERDPSTISHHLGTLEDDGLVVREKDGRSVVNELANGAECVFSEVGTPLEEGLAESSASAPADD